MKYLLLPFLFLFFSACSTLEVQSDYDDSYDFSKIKTYRVVHYVKKGENTLVNDRITNAIKEVLNAKGYKDVEKNEDIIFVYHYAAKEKVDVRTDYQMIGFGRYAYGGTMVATTSAYEYTEGTIIIDALDPQSEKILFRAVGTLEVEYKKTPQEKRAYVLKIIQKLLKDFPARDEALKKAS